MRGLTDRQFCVAGVALYNRTKQPAYGIGSVLGADNSKPTADETLADAHPALLHKR